MSNAITTQMQRKLPNGAVETVDIGVLSSNVQISDPEEKLPSKDLESILLDIYSQFDGVTTGLSINGKTTGAFYAPSTQGNNGQYLMSKGPGEAPAWVTLTIPSLDGYAKLDDIPSLDGYAKSSDIPTDYVATNATLFTMNGTTKTSSSTGRAFYAPTSVGSSGQYLKSNGSGAPSWANFPTIPSISLNGTNTTSPSFYAPTSSGASGQFLVSNGSGAPKWETLDLSEYENPDLSGYTLKSATLYTLNGSAGTTNSTKSFYAPTGYGSTSQLLKGNGSGNAPTWFTPGYLQLTMNGSTSTYYPYNTTNYSKAWYAPTTVGTAGQYLKSSGSGAPVWADFPDLSVYENPDLSSYVLDSTTLYNLNGSAGSASSTKSFYAPTSGGTSGYYLKGNGTTSAPVWQSPMDSTSASAISTNATLVTERDVYYGLPNINNSHAYTSSSTYYAPTAGGTSGYTLVGNGTTSAPVWQGNPFAECTAATTTYAKTASITNFKLVGGARVVIKFTNASYSGTATNITLNINSTGAKSVMWYNTVINGATVGAGSSNLAPWSAGDIVEFVYDSSNQYWRITKNFNRAMGNLGFTINGSNTVWYEGIGHGVSMTGFYAPTSVGSSGQYLKSNGSGAPSWASVSDSTSASAISTGSSLVTERDVYYGLPNINNSHGYTSSNTYYAPTAGGTTSQLLKGNGTTSAPVWFTPGYFQTTLNGSSTTYYPYNTNSYSVSWYAPTGAGTAGYELVSNGSGAPLWKAPSYTTCSTTAATVAKTTGTITNFKLVSGVRVTVKFTETNTASSPTLSVSGTTATAIKSMGFNGTEWWRAGDYVDFLYDGTNWVIVGSSSASNGYFYGNVRLKNSSNYGNKLSFGDGDYVYLYENADDQLEIKATTMNLMPSGSTSGTVNINGATANIGATNTYLKGPNVYLGSAATYRVVGTSTGYATKIHVSATEPTMSVGDIWLKIPS